MPKHDSEQEMAEKEQEKVWDAIAEQWFRFRQEPFKDVGADLIRLSGKWQRGKILEIGCGNCRNLLPFARAGFDCYGIDFSKKMLKYARIYAREKGFNVKLKKANATKLPFSNEFFDYVLCIATLHHLNKEQQSKAIAEIWRVLKRGGEAYISVWNKLNPRWLFKKHEQLVPWHVKGKTYLRYYYFFWPFELKKALKQVGFKIQASFWLSKNLRFLIKKP
ncbi:MAG: methyltransferase domain-containing protein [Candidatus Pacearchaeota archaeon]